MRSVSGTIGHQPGALKIIASLFLLSGEALNYSKEKQSPQWWKTVETFKSEKLTAKSTEILGLFL